VVKKIYNKQFALSLFELLMLLIQDGVAYFLIIFSYYNHLIDVGDVTLYLLATITLSQTIRTFLDNLREANTNLQYSTSYFDYIEDKSYYSKTGNHKRFDYGTQLEIEFKNVSFQYNNTNNKVLDNVSFKINAGEKIAIVGINGAGKSTIVKLISGLLFPDNGEILINGINVKDFDNQEYSSMFSTVFQDVTVYATTILENVGGDNYSIDRVKECITRVGLKSKVESLPLQYNTQLLKVLDNKGIELSGGENQKLAIARALYKQCNCVILDEPTSALDALTEASIYQSFNELVNKSTDIYISHRLSSTKFCDRILLFNKSGLVEEGSHDSLMELKGDYYNMFVVQGKYYQQGSKEND
jgi:ATP-binding cassette subfamily B protein/ATP-binding cassette subfamily C protein